jgi:hypothetical protein
MFNNKISTTLIRLTSFLLITLGVIIVLKMTHKSVWIDEAALLKNIISNKSYLDFFYPLPYSKQAEPFIASLFFKFTTEYISYDYQLIRSVIAMCLVVFIWPLLLIFKKKPLAQLVLVLVVILNLPILSYYFTEIKHYFFEILASSFMIYSIYLYNETKNLSKAIFILSIVTLLGFSTLIPSIITFIYFLLSGYRNNRIIFKKETLWVSGFYVLIILATYFHMKYLTSQQTSLASYVSKGVVNDLWAFKRLVFMVYGPVFIYFAGFSTIYALFVNHKSLLFKLNVIFVVLLLVVVFGKLIGVYPIISERHLVWILPYSIVITSLCIMYLLEKQTLFRYFGYALIIGLFYLSITISYDLWVKKLPERTANNNLYHYVSKMNKSTIVIFPSAIPSFEYYIELIPFLKKHEYSLDTGKNSIEHSIPKGKFYYLLSHSESIDDTRKTYRSKRTERVREIFNKNSCTYTSVFLDFSVQLLEVTCKDKAGFK